jgi:hypothetical protein
MRCGFTLRVVQIVEKIHKPKVRLARASPMNFGRTWFKLPQERGLENSQEKSRARPCFFIGFVYFCTPFRIWGESILCP